MSYDHTAALVFVGQLTIEREPSMYDLCRRHLDVLSAPRGWSVRREPLVLVGEESRTGLDEHEWHATRVSSERNAI
jgi:hypothetical protein